MNIVNMVREMRTIKKLLTDAETEARAMGEQEPAAEHLLLAALGLGDGSARRILERFGVDPPALRDAILRVHAESLVMIGLDPPRAAELSAAAPLEPASGAGIYRSGASAREAFQQASTMARRRKPSRLTGAHVVAAVAGMEQGTAARVFEALGINRQALLAEAEAEIGGLAGRTAG